MHILLVEDEEAHAELVHRAFTLWDGPVDMTVAPSLAEARARIEKAVPDLAIIDLRLPDGEGIELLQAAADTFPVVIMTSHGDEQVAVEAMKAGALDYVVKSETMLVQMPRIVERVLREWGYILERRRAEDALRESERRFRVLFEYSPVAVWEVDYTAVHAMLTEGAPTGLPDLLSYLAGQATLVEACARAVNVLGVNQASVELFEAGNAGALAAALSGLFIRQMAPAFKQMLAAIYEHRTLLDMDTTVETLKGNARAITLRWAVPPGHEQTYSRVLISMVDLTERKRLEKEILEISSREQRRIGDDLHDGLGQLLAGTRYTIARLVKRLQQKGVEEEVTAALEIDQFVAEAMSQAKALAHGLTPVGMEADGLVQALKGLVYTTERLYGLPCRLRCQEPVYVNDLETATQVYRIAQEALNNAMRHSHASKLEVTLAQQGNSTVLTVRDDGDGIPEDAGEGGGMGLRIMKYRARMIQGTLDVRRVPQGGTLVTCNFPTDPRRHRSGLAPTHP